MYHNPKQHLEDRTILDFSLSYKNIIEYDLNNLSYLSYKNQAIHEHNINKISSDLSSFNSHFFCPIILNKNNKFYNPGMHKLLKDLYKLQFPSSDECYSPSHRYLIVDHSSSNGLFSQLRSWRSYFTIALVLNRTLLFYGHTEHIASAVYCPTFKYFPNVAQCYLLPVSNCSVVRILNMVKTKTTNLSKLLKHNNHRLNINNGTYSYFLWSKGGVPAEQGFYGEIFCKITQKYYTNYDPEANEEILKPFNKWDVIHMTRWGVLRHPGHCSTVYRQSYNLSILEYSSVIYSFFLRTQPFLTKIINQIVNASFTKYLYNYYMIDNRFSDNIHFNKFNINNTISMMIRWGDKCFGYQKPEGGFPIRPEMDCYKVDEYMNIAILLKKYILPNINTIIITSENKDIINEILFKYYDIKKYGFKFLINVKDVQQGTSEIQKYSKTTNPIAIIISMLSTMRIQFGAKYYLIQPISGWNNGIFSLSKNLQCKPLYIDNGFDNIQVKRLNIELKGDSYLTRQLKHKQIGFHKDILNIMDKRNLSFLHNNSNLTNSLIFDLKTLVNEW